MEESREFYERSVALDPGIFQTLYGWAQMEETDRNFDRARELIDAAEKLSPDNPRLDLQRAVLYGRTRDYDKAVATLDALERRRGERGLWPIEWSQKGLLLDRMARPAEAFAPFAAGRDSCMASSSAPLRQRVNRRELHGFPRPFAAKLALH